MVGYQLDEALFAHFFLVAKDKTGNFRKTILVSDFKQLKNRLCWCSTTFPLFRPFARHFVGKMIIQNPHVAHPLAQPSKFSESYLIMTSMTGSSHLLGFTKNA